MKLNRGRALRNRLLWALVALAAVSGAWILKIEIAYRQNVSRLPALLNYHRHVITRVWRA